jgi:transglutaminase-like putative cysteine protease/Flp pilus assembly protein TadD
MSNRSRAALAPLGLAIVFLLFSSRDAANAQAEPAPYEAEVAAHVAEAGRAGRSPRAILPVIELYRQWNDVRPSVTLAALDRLAADRRLSVPVRQYAAQLAARGRLRSGDVAASERAVEQLGYIRTWRVVGPFDNEGKTGFAHEYEPEALRMAAVDRDARFEGRERPVGWRDYPDVGHFGYVSFDAVFRPDTNVCAYAETWVTSERAQPLSLWIGGGGAIAAWWNGQEVLRDAAYRQPDPDRASVMVGAQQGPNRLLVKACASTATWGFYARLGDATGAPATGLSYAREGDASAVHPSTARLPAAPLAPLAALEAAATGAHPSAQALEDLARLLAYTGGDDPAEQRAKQLAERAAEAQPTAARWVLAATLATARGDASRFLDRATALAPNDPVVLLARARLVVGGPSPEDALAILDRIPATPASTEWLDAAEVRADLLEDLGLAYSSRAVLEEAARHAPGAPRWMTLRVHAADAVGARDESIALATEALAARFDDQSMRELLINDAITRGETDRALALIDDYRALGNDHTGYFSHVADWYDALGRRDEAMGMYRLAMDLAPEEANVHVAYAHALLRNHQEQVAVDELRQALVLRPADAETRELLESMQPEERADEAFAVSEEDLLARVSDDARYPARLLEELTVNTVFDNGLGSSFHQVAAQIVNDQGARDWRTYSIQFDPDVQRVSVRLARVTRGGRHLEATESFEQQLGEPWYRIYYDTRAFVIVFPDLEPGDVVEIRYRVDDVAERNQFADYYGDLHYLAGQTPIARIDYVLMTPTARTFYFNEPHLTQLQHEQRTEGARRIDHFHADDVDAIRSEDGMPGQTEVVPYLHVSTFQSWNDVGRWWWGLVHDQLYADEHLQQVVHQLVDGVTDLRERVQRIYRWVIDNTRYVGLEFGIHGFLPYRVPQIVQRGFGDCKDKASLIYTMLTAAGIDARLVLVRTRHNGAITDLPASLSIFDHAIAYVPELDLFLDGTAEFSGTTDFPQMDQGVTVLVVGPEGAELRRSPQLPSEHDRRTRTLTVELAADGSARLTGHDEVRGSEAPGYRSTYQAEGTRHERFERAMRGIFPGITVQRESFAHLTEFEQPVTYEYTASAPSFAVRDADGLRVPGSVLDELTRTIARTEARTFALDLGGRSSYVEDRTIRGPSGYTVGSVPEGGVIDSPFGHFAMQVSREGNEVRVHTELSLERDTIPAADYAAFRAWVGRADAMLRGRVVLIGGAR